LLRIESLFIIIIIFLAIPTSMSLTDQQIADRFPEYFVL